MNIIKLIATSLCLTLLGNEGAQAVPSDFARAVPEAHLSIINEQALIEPGAFDIASLGTAGRVMAIRLVLAGLAPVKPTMNPAHPRAISRQTLREGSRAAWWAAGVMAAVALAGYFGLLSIDGHSFHWQVAAAMALAPRVLITILRTDLKRLAGPANLEATNGTRAPPAEPEPLEELRGLFGFQNAAASALADYAGVRRSDPETLLLHPDVVKDLIAHPLRTRWLLHMKGVPGHEAFHRHFPHAPEWLTYLVAQILPAMAGVGLGAWAGGALMGLAGITGAGLAAGAVLGALIGPVILVAGTSLVLSRANLKNAMITIALATVNGLIALFFKYGPVQGTLPVPPETSPLKIIILSTIGAAVLVTILIAAARMLRQGYGARKQDRESRIKRALASNSPSLAQRYELGYEGADDVEFSRRWIALRDLKPLDPEEYQYPKDYLAHLRVIAHWVEESEFDRVSHQVLGEEWSTLLAWFDRDATFESKAWPMLREIFDDLPINRREPTGSLLWIGNIALGALLAILGTVSVHHGISLSTLGWAALGLIPMVIIHEALHFPVGLIDVNNSQAWTRGFRVKTSGAKLLIAPLASIVLAVAAWLLWPSNPTTHLILLEAIVINALALVPGSRLTKLPGGAVWKWLWEGSDMDEYLDAAANPAQTEPGTERRQQHFRRRMINLVRWAENLLAPGSKETPAQTILHFFRWAPLLFVVILILRGDWYFSVPAVASFATWATARFLTVISTLRQIRQGRIDPLTGLLTHNALEMDSDNGFLPRLFRWAIDPKSPATLGVLFIDIDHFRMVNDVKGRREADKILRRIAQTIQGTVADTDEVIRYGGEEILVLLRDVDGPQAEAIAQKIRQAVYDLNIPMKELAYGRVTISVGVACAEKDPEADVRTRDKLNALLKTADEALYEAKSSREDYPGRNAVVRRAILVPPQTAPPVATPVENPQDKLRLAGRRLADVFGDFFLPVPGESGWRTAMSSGGWLLYAVTSGLLWLGVIYPVWALTPLWAMILTFVSDRAIEHTRLWRRLRKELIDPRTGVLSRRYLGLERTDGPLPRLYRRAIQPGGSFQLRVIGLDLDNFKEVNTVYGHLVGDQVLREVARVLTAAAPKHTVVRYAGKRFVILLENTDAATAWQIAEKLREAVRSYRQDPNSISLTASLGLSETPEKDPNPDANLLVKTANWLESTFDAVERAKTEDGNGGPGGNRIELAKSGPTNTPESSDDLQTAIEKRGLDWLSPVIQKLSPRLQRPRHFRRILRRAA